jgi:PAP2 superfamily
MASFHAVWLQYPLVPAVALVLMGCCVYALMHGTGRRLNLLMAALMLAIPGQILAALGAVGADRLRPYKLDLYIYGIDRLLGFQPSFALGRMVLGHSSTIVLLALTYQLLPLAMVAIFAGYLWHRPEQEAWSMVWVFLLNLALSVPFYLLCPVCGPAYAFPGFPALPSGPVVPHPILLDAPANGVPSIHFSTALLVLWYGRKLPLGRSIGAAYVALTALSTLASGEHYLFDLLVAVPYAAMVAGLVNRARRAGVIMFPTWITRAHSRAC